MAILANSEYTDTIFTEITIQYPSYLIKLFLPIIWLI